MGKGDGGHLRHRFCGRLQGLPGTGGGALGASGSRKTSLKDLGVGWKEGDGPRLNQGFHTPLNLMFPFSGR